MTAIYNAGAFTFNVLKTAVYCTPILGECSRWEESDYNETYNKLFPTGPEYYSKVYEYLDHSRNEAALDHDLEHFEKVFKKQILFASCKVVRKTFYLAITTLFSVAVGIAMAPTFSTGNLALLIPAIAVVSLLAIGIFKNVKQIRNNYKSLQAVRQITQAKKELKALEARNLHSREILAQIEGKKRFIRINALKEERKNLQSLAQHEIGKLKFGARLAEIQAELGTL